MTDGRVCWERMCFGFALSSAVMTMIALTTDCGSIRASSRISPTQNPLVAQYNLAVSGPAQAWVEFGLDSTYGRQTSAVTIPGRSNNLVPVLVAGMVQSSTYHMRAHVQWDDGSVWVDQDHTFSTGAVPTSLAPPTITVSQPNASLMPAPGVELLSNDGNLEGVATDLKGNIIWFCPGYALPLKLMQNGHFIVLQPNDLLEIDLACNTIRDVSVTQVNQSLQANNYDFTVSTDMSILGSSPFSHDVLVLPNGHWITICQIEKSFTDLPGYPGNTNVVGNGVLDIDPNGNVAWAWSSFDYLDINRHLMGLPDWTHANALVYTPDGNLLLSMRAQSWVLKLDYENGTGLGNILWKLGNEGDFTLLGEDASQWFYAQHFPHLISTNGSQMILAVYDDGNSRPDSDGVVCGTTSSASACYSRATIFQVDESTNLVTLLWQDLPGFYSFWGGSVKVLSNGDVEFDNSEPFFPANPNTSVIVEVTETDTPTVVWQMTISGENAYRAFRIPSLYPGVTWTQ